MRHIALMSGLILAAFTAAPQNAAAQNHYMTARELLQLCHSSFNTDYGYCAGYVTGVADTLLGGGTACHKISVKSQQLRDIAVRHMEKYPDSLDRPARNTVTEALAAAFPCR